MQPIKRQVVVDRRQPALRWSAVFAGVAVSSGLWVLLQLFGLGFGLMAVDAADVDSLARASTGTAVLSVIAILVALFVGGIVAGRSSGTISRGMGATHGLVLWAITTGLAAIAIIWFLGMVGGGVRPGELEVSSASGTMVAVVSAGNAMLWAGVALLLGLLSAVFGGALGARRQREDIAVIEDDVT
jgi:hypothetical protein